MDANVNLAHVVLALWELLVNQLSHQFAKEQAVKIVVPVQEARFHLSVSKRISFANQIGVNRSIDVKRIQREVLQLDT